MPNLSDYEESTIVPRIALQLPVELPIPDGFDPESPETWPRVEGRLEHIGGRLLYMPPCADEHGRVVTGVVAELALWQRRHPEFVVGTNEVGVQLGGDTRGLDAAVWLASALGAPRHAFSRVPPALAVEVAGRDDSVDALREKARWYLAHGVGAVWILVPGSRSALVVTREGEREVEPGGRLPAHPSLPGLEPCLSEVFRQLDAR